MLDTRPPRYFAMKANLDVKFTASCHREVIVKFLSQELRDVIFSAKYYFLFRCNANAL